MPTFPLARALQDSGHRVLYAGPPSCAYLTEGRKVPWSEIIKRIEAAGYEFCEVAHGLADARANSDALEAMECVYTSAIDDCATLMRKRNVDVLLLDPFIWFAAIGAAREGVPIISIKTNLRARINGHVPPSTSRFVPHPGLASRLRIITEWFTILIGWKFLGWLHPASRRLLRFVRKTRRDGRRVGLRLAVSDYHPEFILPEVTLCPATFDFAMVPGGLYIGTSDATRSSEPFVWPIRSGSYRVYCSAGTMTGEFPEDARKLIDICLRLANEQRDLSMLIQVPRSLWPPHALMPDNVLMREWVPQCGVLNHAEAAVVAGGLGTIKECIVASTPPVVVSPRHADKPGNAARVAFHRLGTQLPIEQLSKERLAFHLASVRQHAPEFRANMVPIQREMQNPAATNRLVRMIEELLPIREQARRSSATSSTPTKG